MIALAMAWMCPFAAMAANHPANRTQTGVLTGRLTDWHSVPLGQAVVVARNLTTGTSQQGISSKNGAYRFAGLEPGEYRLEADVPELGKGAVEGIEVAAGHETRVQAALVMELPVRSLPVETDLRGLDPVLPAVTTMISSEELSEVPVRTRDWQEFAEAVPAVHPQPGLEGRGGGLEGNPGGPDDNAGALEALISGGGFAAASAVDGMQPSPSSAGVGGRAGSGRSSRATESLGASAVLTMEARTGNGSAETGGGLGGTVALESNRGRTGLHGQLSYLNRQSLWGARNPFTQWVKETAPVSGVHTAQFTPEPYSPANSRQTFGLGIGSQLWRDKLFWFAAIDGLLTSDPAVATVRHPENFFAQPTLTELTELAARLGLPATDPADEGAAAYSQGLEQLAGLLGPVPRRSAEFQGFGRVDWQATERQHVSVEGQAARENAPGGAIGRSSETYGSHSFGNSQATDFWGLAKLDSFFTANVLNTAGAQYRHLVERQTAQVPSPFESPLLANDFGQLPEIVADSKYGFILGKPARLANAGQAGGNPDEQLLTAQDTLSWVHGAHLIRAGASFDHIADGVNSLVNQTGTYSYADVLNFLSDFSSFTQYGFNGVDNPFGTDQHNCDGAGKTALGYFPCYAWYSQRVGPSTWNVSSNDVAGFVTEQWQPAHNLTISAGVRVEGQQLPPPIASVANAALPATGKLPALGLKWAPRVGLAYSPMNGMVLRAGAGMYFGRVDNSALLAALTQTGSVNGDLNFFFKPTDPQAPPFPYVFSTTPQTVVTPGAVAFGSGFKTQEVDQGVVSLEQELPGHWVISVSGLGSLGRRLPIAIDTNLAPALDAAGQPQTITYDVVDALSAGPVKAPKITVPLYTSRLNQDYQQLATLESRANSTYEAGMVKIVRNGGNGLSLHAHYLYAHATDWNPNESGNLATNDVLDPADFELEYGTSNLDIRHSAGATVLYRTPWKMNGWAGSLTNAWTVAAVAQFRSGLPFTMRTSGYLPAYYQRLESGGLTRIEGVATGLNGSGGDNRVYGMGSDGATYNIGRNTYRYPSTYTGNFRLAKRFDLSRHRELELLAESFNLFNHENVTQVETTGYAIYRGSTSGSPATLNFLTGLTSTGQPSTTPEFGKPLDVNATNYYRPREFQFGLRARF